MQLTYTSDSYCRRSGKAADVGKRLSRCDLAFDLMLPEKDCSRESSAVELAGWNTCRRDAQNGFRSTFRFGSLFVLLCSVSSQFTPIDNI